MERVVSIAPVLGGEEVNDMQRYTWCMKMFFRYVLNLTDASFLVFRSSTSPWMQDRHVT